jgi:hypothetical protein
MLTGTALVSKVTEMQAQEPPAKMSDIVRACGYEIDGKLRFTQFYTELLDAKGLLNKDPEPEISEEYQKTYDRLCDFYGQDAVEAFLTIWEESDLEHFEDAYQGRYDSEADFAEQTTIDCHGSNIPSFVVVDWQATWDQWFRYDYEFVDGAVFLTSW